MLALRRPDIYGNFRTKIDMKCGSENNDLEGPLVRIFVNLRCEKI